MLLTGRIPLFPSLFGVAALGLSKGEQLHRLVERVGRPAGSAGRNSSSLVCYGTRMKLNKIFGQLHVPPDSVGAVSQPHRASEKLPDSILNLHECAYYFRDFSWTFVWKVMSGVGYPYPLNIRVGRNAQLLLS